MHGSGPAELLPVTLTLYFACSTKPQERIRADVSVGGSRRVKVASALRSFPPERCFDRARFRVTRFRIPFAWSATLLKVSLFASKQTANLVNSLRISLSVQPNSSHV